MSWKKNVFSCLMWAVYLLMIGTAMIFTGRVICDSFEVAGYFELVMPAAYLLLTGILVFVLHRLAVNLGADSRRAGKGSVWIEALLIPVLFAAGIFLRWTEMQSEAFAVPDDSVYLELSYISADGQGIPQFAHGAVYLYLWGLRLCFMVLGNKAAAAVWLQIVLQLFSVLLLHFAVRKMAGRFPAAVMVAFFMLTPYMVEKSLVLSPEMLYLLAFSVVLLFVSQGVKYRFGWGFWLATGVLAAVMAYLDVAGFLLLPLMLGVIVMRREDDGRKSLSGLAGSLLGLLAGAAGCVSADVMGSGKTFSGIIGAWGNLYRWEDIQLSVTLPNFDIVWMINLIQCIMERGI
ncbi:MAG: glycosyltransferase family 39 protein, partial [Acetatifactor sp.]|nr:glycosyltransferase family 39 protein [Acetatifactor sp.]